MNIGVCFCNAPGHPIAADSRHALLPKPHITQANSTFSFVITVPDKAGIDPFALLIDRAPDDNLKTVTIF